MSLRFLAAAWWWTCCRAAIPPPTSSVSSTCVPYTTSYDLTGGTSTLHGTDYSGLTSAQQHQCPYRYRVRLPVGYSQLPDDASVLVVLHGGVTLPSASDDPSESYRAAMSAAHALVYPHKPSAVDAATSDWDPAKLESMVAQVSADLRLSAHRTLLTGASMGGRGTIIAAAAKPTLFAPRVFAQCPHHEPYSYASLAPTIVANGQFVAVGMTRADPVSSVSVAQSFVAALGSAHASFNETADFGHCTGTLQWAARAMDAYLQERCPPGDVNGDSDVDVADVVLCVRAVLDDDSTSRPCPADVDGDAQINVVDVVSLVSIIVGGRRR